MGGASAAIAQPTVQHDMKVYQYYCLQCGSSALITDAPITSMKQRKTDQSWVVPEQAMHPRAQLQPHAHTVHTRTRACTHSLARTLARARTHFCAGVG